MFFMNLSFESFQGLFWMSLWMIDVIVNFFATAVRCLAAHIVLRINLAYSDLWDIPAAKHNINLVFFRNFTRVKRHVLNCFSLIHFWGILLMAELIPSAFSVATSYSKCLYRALYQKLREGFWVCMRWILSMTWLTANLLCNIPHINVSFCCLGKSF